MNIKTITLVAALSACFFVNVSVVAEEYGTNNPVDGDCNNTIAPMNWKQQQSAYTPDAKLDKKIQKLLSKMSLEEKVGQVIQPDIAFVTPKDVKKYHIGAILNGGNSAPNQDNRSKPDAWLALADEFWEASVTKKKAKRIPLMWGTDAVHGHNNIVGATIYPHNIGLGAANDPELIQRIASATAKEIRVTGMDWTFAPTVAVVRNDRWGRTYESYSENPEIVEKFSAAYVTGLQGAVGSKAFLGKNHLLATVKHFVGDGGTKDGVDQGDSVASEQEMRDIHAAGYPSAIRAGALVAMASFNSWCGKKLHGYKPLLTDVLRDRMGFDGFVVGDWNGHAQVKGCSKSSCAAAFNAGLDMYMAPDEWKALYKNLLQQVKSGVITQARLDEAVQRILRVKYLAGIMSSKKPSDRPYAGDWDVLGSPEHREIAREAVRKSLVLLKNNHSILPLVPMQNVLVAGAAADDIGIQSGGWTLSWQGDGNNNAHFPNGQSIYAGIEEAVVAAGGQASLSKNGDFENKPDVAIVVFGERPYAEFRGDVAHLDLRTSEGLALLKKFKAQNIPTVAVFLSGRPMWVNPEINLSDAFVAAWLPGSEGGGIADVIFKKKDGSVKFDFTGKLSFSWPNKATDTELNVGNASYQPLFPYGYGLTAKDAKQVAQLSEVSGVEEEEAAPVKLLAAGDAVEPLVLYLADKSGLEKVDAPNKRSAGGSLTIDAADFKAQEDTSLFQWKGVANWYLSLSTPQDWQGYLDNGYVLQMRYQVLGDSVGNTALRMSCGEKCGADIDITKQLKEQRNKGWQMSEVPLSCFADKGVDFSKVKNAVGMSSSAGTTLQIIEISLIQRAVALDCDFG